MNKLAVVLLLLADPCAAAPTLSSEVAVSSAPKKESAPIQFKFDQTGRSVGAKGGLSEGKPLEVAVWGTGGAVAGSLAGPPGALIGAGVGAVLGLLYSVFVVPHNGPGK